MKSASGHTNTEVRPCRNTNTTTLRQKARHNRPKCLRSQTSPAKPAIAMTGMNPQPRRRNRRTRQMPGQYPSQGTGSCPAAPLWRSRGDRDHERADRRHHQQPAAETPLAAHQALLQGLSHPAVSHHQRQHPAHRLRRGGAVGSDQPAAPRLVAGNADSPARLPRHQLAAAAAPQPLYPRTGLAAYRGTTRGIACRRRA